MKNWDQTQYAEIKKHHKLDNTKLSAMFGYKNERSFTCSTAYRSMVEGLVKFYEATREEEKKV